ncbi:MAG TPA: type IX secretion system sortase PorU, partial [Chitinophagaceae bacterium]
MLLKKLVVFVCCLLPSCFVFAQRSYHPHSVLATGTWFKIIVKDAGIYKIDLAFLSTLGVNTSNLSSASIRLYGNGGYMLPEDNGIQRPDDLIENSIQVIDGGDGIINGPDYILFYAPGPDEWLKDSANKKFIHRKNLYSDVSYYYLTVSGTGKRIPASPGALSPSVSISSFDERYFHELDTVNFLSSGKEWYGEEFTDAPGKSLSARFDKIFPGLLTNEPVTVISECVARSAGNPSLFKLLVNNQLVQQLMIPATGTAVDDPFANQTKEISSFNAVQPELSFTYTFMPGSFNAQGWLNWFEVFCRRQLSMTNSNQLLFRDWRSVGNSSGEYVISNAQSGLQVWDVTDPLSPVKMTGDLQGGEYRFVNDCSALREYIAFNNTAYLLPLVAGKIENQDLHDAIAAEYLIVTPPEFISEAQRLAQFHLTKNNLRSKVVTTSQVFNEFSSGTPDPTAIRDFVKMYYDKFTTATDSLKYLLLFGSASFDYKNRVLNNTNLVPAYESSNSLDPLSTYTSDDFFGFLEDHENINSQLLINTLDIGIGRVPERTQEQAKNYVDKVEAYYAKESFGPWRNNLTFIADDEDNNLHLQDAEVITQTAAQ